MLVDIIVGTASKDFKFSTKVDRSLKGAFLERADSGRQTDPLQVKFQWILAELRIIQIT